MSLENSKKLYAHYIEIGYSKAAEDLLRKYPNFKDDVRKEDTPEELGSDDGKRKVESKGNSRKKK